MASLPPDASTPQHDRSVWRGLVVPADEFAPASRSRGRLIWVICGAIVVIAAGVVAILRFG